MRNNSKMQKLKNKQDRRLKARKINDIIRTKLVWLFGIVVLALVALCVRVTYINATQGQQYKQQVLSQSQQKYGSQTIPFQRGDILDRNGTVLATSEKVYNIILDCKVVNTELEGEKRYVEPTVKAMVEVLGLDEDTIRGYLTDEKTKKKEYLRVAYDVSITVKKNFEAYTDTKQEGLTKEEKKERANVKGVWFEDTYKRVYPLDSLACDVVGFISYDNVADWGLEGYYSSTLNGVDGRQYGYYNADADIEQTIIDPINGNSIVSTIDANIQQAAEKYINILMDGLACGPRGEAGAKNIGVIVANPNNGEILAMASNNPYDLNHAKDLSPYYSQMEIEHMTDQEIGDARYSLWKNYCISDAFEPGSTVKPITIASALQADAIPTDASYYCDGYEMIGNTMIRCSIYPKEHEVETLADLIKNSCNDGLMQIAEQMTAKSFLKYQKVFNYGSITGIDLPGEAAGLLHSPSQLLDGSTELATASFGQGYTCTMIQNVAALCSVINGGNYYKPHVVSRILDDDGNVVEEIEPVLLKQTISSEISALIREYMGTVCAEGGTGYSAKVDGYSMGGKTGTAQKFPRSAKTYLVSYVGFAPLDNPQVLIYVVVDEPNVEHQADSKYARYLAKMIMSEILPYMNIFPDEELTGQEDQKMLYFQETILAQAEEYRRQKENGAYEEDYVRDDDGAGGINDPNYSDQSNEASDNPEMPIPPEDGSELDLNNNQESNGITNEEAGMQNGGTQ